MPTTEEKLRVLAVQSGHPGLIEVRDVATMMELRDEEIKILKEQIQDIMDEPRRRAPRAVVAVQ